MELKLKTIEPADCAKLLEFELENQNYFEQFVPPRPDGFLSAEGIEKSVGILVEEMKAGSGAYFLLWRGENVIGRINFAKLETGKADMGYRIAQSETGKGVATLGLKMAIERLAADFRTSEIVAETTLSNLGSIRVLEKCGFMRVGISPNAAILHGKTIDLVQFQLS